MNLEYGVRWCDLEWKLYLSCIVRNPMLALARLRSNILLYSSAKHFQSSFVWRRFKLGEDCSYAPHFQWLFFVQEWAERALFVQCYCHRALLKGCLEQLSLDLARYLGQYSEPGEHGGCNVPIIDVQGNFVIWGIFQAQSEWGISTL